MIKLKIANRVFLSLIALCLFAGCDKYEMIKYESTDLLNFRGYDQWGLPSDDAGFLGWDGNFGINPQGDSLLIDTVKVGVKISGERASHARKVVFKIENVSEDQLDVIFRDDYVIAADSGAADFQVYVKRPAMRNVEYEAKIYVDYEKSEFAPGTEERQVFKLKCRDVVTPELWKVNSLFDYVFGEWSETKARFMITTIGMTSFADWYSSSGFYEDYYELLDAFEVYKADPSNPPLLDDNGEWISFPSLF